MEIANMMLKELQESPYGKPDQVTYGSFMKACQYQMVESESRYQVINVIFKKCCRDGQVGHLILSQLKYVVSESQFLELVGKPVEDDFKLHDLPVEWWCNVVEGDRRHRKKIS